jgi:tripartite-type tricarboxylate transporter receptor subunit TctC
MPDRTAPTPLRPLRRRRLLLAAAAAPLLPRPARTTAFPARPIRLIVPFAPGGGTDLSARLVMARIATTLGQQVVIENRGGAGGDIAMLAAAAAPADGHTLILGNDGVNARGPAMREQMPYDPVKAFTPVARLVFAWSAFAIHKSIPPRSLGPFVAHAKANPGALNYGSSGPGTLAHVATSLFAHHHGLEVVHVPYRGAALAAQDLAAGRLQFSFLTAGGLLPMLASPALHVAAVSGARRSAAFPEAPTMVEAGFPELDISTWYGVFAPAGTPREAVELLARHMEMALAEPEIQARLEEQSLVPAFLPTQRFGTYVDSQIANWAEVSRRTGLRF